MILARRNVALLIVLLSVALIGLLAVQSYLLRQTLQARQQAFDRNVSTAMTSVARTIEAQEVRRQARTYLRTVPGQLDSLQVLVHGDGDYVWAEAESLHAARFDEACPPGAGLKIDQYTLEAHVDTYDLRRPRAIPRFDIERSAVGRVITGGNDPAQRLVFMFNDAKSDLVGKIFGDLAAREEEPIAERIEPARVDSLLAAELLNVGIDTKAEFAISQDDGDSLVVVSSAADENGLRGSPYRTALFPLDLRPPFPELIVHLPAGRAWLWWGMAPLMAATLAFTALIVFCFGRAVRTILEQRRFTAQTVDFINNMTHEFKTPLATVALAGEALARPDVQADPDVVDRYTGMIRDENRRMHRQVEKILQMAQLETGDLQLSRGDVDLHELIGETAASLALQVEHRGGTLATDLRARRHVVHGDPVHLRGMLTNLLDNAMKYSPETPRIAVATRDDGVGSVVLEVSDRGIGIVAGDRRRVFEKYYRCPTGNRHDVKGFGLGLSYVRLMAEAHGGEVRLRGRRGGGTAVEIRLPTVAEREE